MMHYRYRQDNCEHYLCLINGRDATRMTDDKSKVTCLNCLDKLKIRKVNRNKILSKTNNTYEYISIGGKRVSRKKYKKLMRETKL